MHTFVGRQNELYLLRDVFDSKQSHFCIVRGRRRIGKTSLLKEATKERKDAVFVTGLEDVTSDRKIKNRVTKKLGEFANNSLLMSARDLSWPQIFDHALDIAKSRDGLLLIFDEIQWLARQGSGFLSDLKEAWTTKWQPSGKIKVVICGSSNKFFEYKSGGVESVLHKLRTVSDIWVPPMTLNETGLFCEGWNRHQIALTQMMLGGIPYYLDLISEPDRGFIQCINEAAFSAKTIFFDEVNETLKLDLSSLDRVVQLLSVIGQDGKTMNSISEHALVPTSTVDEILEKLAAYQILFKKYPMGEKARTGNFGARYYIKDEFLNFFFNVLDKEKNRIKINVKGKMLFGKILDNGYYIRNFTGKAFELIVGKIIERNLPVRMNKILSIDNLSNYKVGSYWRTKGDKGSQIDLLVDSDEDRCVRIIEVKWANQKIGAEEGNAIGQALEKDFPNHKKHKVRRFVCASSGFTNGAEVLAGEKEVGLIALDDLF